MHQETKDRCRQRLKKIIAKKFDTTMIFPLSQFEIAFGELWGHEKDETKLTDQEKVNRAKWKELRYNILNNGNAQKRNAMAEIDMHEVEWNRYKTIFIVKEQNEA